MKGLRSGWQMRGLASQKHGHQILFLFVFPLIFVLFGCGGSLPGTPAPNPPGTPPGSPGTPPPSPGTPPGSPGTAVPEEIRGQWQTTILSPTSIPEYLQDTDRIPSYMTLKDSTLTIAFYFFPDGRYQHTWVLGMQYLHCVYSVRRNEDGRVNIKGSAFTFQGTKATFSTQDSCHQTTYHDPAETRTITVNVTPEKDQADWPLLRFGYAPKDLLLEKCRTCK